MPKRSAITVVSPYTPNESKDLFEQRFVRRSGAKKEGYRVFAGSTPEFRTPKGNLVAMMLSGVFTSEEQQRRLQLWQQMRGDLRNRPSVFPKGARQELMRVDGVTPTGRTGVPANVLGLTSGKSDQLGFYRYHGKVKGVPRCGMTRWSQDRPDLYGLVKQDAARVTQVMREHLPKEYTEQLAYINTIPPELTIPNSVFTTVYGLANHPTACHQDSLNARVGTGVLTTAGSFRGNEFILPEYKLAFDLQPDCVLFADVHSWHGNLPKIEGERYAQVYYVRRGMHECGKEVVT